MQSSDCEDTAAGEFPNSFDGIEIRAIRRQKVQAELGRLLATPFQMGFGTMILCVVADGQNADAHFQAAQLPLQGADCISGKLAILGKQIQIARALPVFLEHLQRLSPGTRLPVMGVAQVRNSALRRLGRTEAGSRPPWSSDDLCRPFSG